jgi:leader peptidase (prepilin peptidase)/N-methyltransferase
VLGYVVAAFVGGALIGSFLNVVIYRLPRGESVATGRSMCPHCKKQIRWYDNVPIVSWLALRGRCRDCGAPIHWRYPAVELLTALAFGAIVAANGADEDLILELPFAAMLIACAGIDLEHTIIPNKIVLPAAVFGVAGAAAIDPGMLPELLAAGAGAFLFLLLAALAHPAGMGMGDVKLAGVLGLYLGVRVIPALLIAFLAGTVVGLAIVARQGAEGRKTGVPFGPFLALGGILALLVGDGLIVYYEDHFLS